MSHVCRFKHFLGKSHDVQLLEVIRSPNSKRRKFIHRNGVIRFPVVLKNNSNACFVVEAIIDLNQNEEKTYVNLQTVNALEPVNSPHHFQVAGKNGQIVERRMKVHLCLPSEAPVKIYIPTVAICKRMQSNGKSIYGGRTIRFGTKAREELMKFVFLAKGCTCLLPINFSLMTRRISVNGQKCHIHRTQNHIEKRDARRISCKENGLSGMQVQLYNHLSHVKLGTYEVVDLSENGFAVSVDKKIIGNRIYKIQLRYGNTVYSLEGKVIKKENSETMGIKLIQRSEEYMQYSYFWRLHYIKLLTEYFGGSEKYPPRECEECLEGSR